MEQQYPQGAFVDASAQQYATAQGGFIDASAYQQPQMQAGVYNQDGSVIPPSGSPEMYAYAGQGQAASSYAGAAPEYAYAGAVQYAQGAPPLGVEQTQPAFPAPAPSNVGIGLAPQRPLMLIPLCRKGDRAGIERQLQAGASVMETDVEGNTPLHVAVEAPKNEIATVQCLLEHGADANAVNVIGATPLHYVCMRKINYRGVANILLENAAQINRQTVHGKSPLHFACEKDLAELVEVLCLFGADTNLADVDGNTPVHLTLKESGRDTVKRDVLEHLMTYNACCSYSNCEGLTPVHLACKNGYIRCVQFLVHPNPNAPLSQPLPDPQVLTLKGQCGLHLACLHGHAQVAQLMLQLFPAMLDFQDCEGNTPLHCCAHIGSLDCALVLLKLDANTNIKNLAKKTAFDVAKIRGNDLNNTHNPELVQVLKDAKKGGSCRQS